MKTVFRNFIIFVLFISLSLAGLFTNTAVVKAASSKFYYVTASVGETYQTSGINYHSDIDNTYVIYGTDSTLTSGTKRANALSTSWSVEVNPNDPKTGFSPRYVCKASLTMLNPETTYYYQIQGGGEKSAIYSFKTAANDGSVSSMLFLTDTQSYDQASFNKVENLVKAIGTKDPSINMALITGDIVDRGGYSDQWNSYFNYVPSLQKYQLATIPGNHEYYHSNASAYVSPEYYNQFFYNPQNGPTGRVNSSYYFIYNNVLFVMMDLINRQYLAEHQAWFKEVVANNPTRWIIVGTHAGCFSTGVYDHDASYMKSSWQTIFEECQVDLAISGHEHIYSRKDTVYSKDTTGKNAALGVTYLVGPASGSKQYSAQSTDGFDEVNTTVPNTANVIKTQGSKMTVTLYNTSGNVETSFTLNAKRNGEIATMSDKEILDSITCTYDKEVDRAYINWSTDLWGNVSKISCDGDSVWTHVIPSGDETFSMHTIYAIYPTYNYTFNLTIHLTNGGTLEKTLEVKNIKDPEEENPKPTCNFNWGVSKILAAISTLTLIALLRRKK